MKALMAVFWKELADDFTSRRFLIIFPLVFMASVSAAYVAAQGLKPVFGSEEEVVQSVRETLAKAAPGGGYIASSSNSIHPGCRPENYVAMVGAIREYGVYP